MAVWVTLAEISCDTCNRQTCKSPFPEWEIDGQEYKICPLKLIKTEYIALIPWYYRYQKGIFPNAGGLLDQTPGYIRAMEIIGACINEYETNKTEKKKWRQGVN